MKTIILFVSLFSSFNIHAQYQKYHSEAMLPSVQITEDSFKMDVKQNAYIANIYDYGNPYNFKFPSWVKVDGTYLLLYNKYTLIVAEYSQHKLNGFFVEKDTNGCVQSESQYFDGRKNGIFRKYYPCDTLHICHSFIDDRLEGREVTYFQNGRVEQTSWYQGNLKNGVDSNWNENGVLISTEPYLNGKIHGRAIIFYPNGKIKEIATFNNQYLDGWLIQFNKKGKVKKSFYYVYGVKYKF
jgi:antitoxin component YwqK of YwqJK toxin-antitoxin module